MFTVEDNIFQTFGYSSVTQNLNKKSVSELEPNQYTNTGMSPSQ